MAVSGWVFKINCWSDSRGKPRAGQLRLFNGSKSFAPRPLAPRVALPALLHFPGHNEVRRLITPSSMLLHATQNLCMRTTFTFGHFLMVVRAWAESERRSVVAHTCKHCISPAATRFEDNDRPKLRLPFLATSESRAEWVNCSLYVTRLNAINILHIRRMGKPSRGEA